MIEPKSKNSRVLPVTIYGKVPTIYTTRKENSFRQARLPKTHDVAKGCRVWHLFRNNCLTPGNVRQHRQSIQKVTLFKHASLLRLCLWRDFFSWHETALSGKTWNDCGKSLLLLCLNYGDTITNSDDMKNFQKLQLKIAPRSNVYNETLNGYKQSETASSGDLQTYELKRNHISRSFGTIS